MQPAQNELIEIKRCRAQKDSLDTIIAKGINQVMEYLHRKRLHKGYLLVVKECLTNVDFYKTFADYEKEHWSTLGDEEYAVQTYIIPRLVTKPQKHSNSE